MKLICQNCHTEIDQEHVSLNQGIACCPNCNNYFRIAEFLTTGEELRRIKKPDYSNIAFIQSSNQSGINYEFSIPSSGWNRNANSFLIISLIGSAILLGTLFNHQLPFYYLIPLFLLGILLFLPFIFTLKGKINLKITETTSSIEWSLFGLTYTMFRKTNGLDQVKEEVAYYLGDDPVYQIVLYFKQEKKLKFGANLRIEEQKWLLGELNELIAQLNLKKLKKALHC